MSTQSANIAAIVPSLHSDLVVEERPVPTPGPGEILVRNRAIGINPIDWKRVAWNYLIPSYPVVLGADVSGEVVEAGPSVTAFKPGDHVIGFAHSFVSGSNDNGAFQTYTVTKEAATALLPPNLVFEQGATLPTAVGTAALALFDVLGLSRPPNDAERKPPQEADPASPIILIWGGASIVGFMSIQLARLAGLTVFTTASRRHHEALRAAGASQVFDYHSGTVSQDIAAAVTKTGKRIDYVFDPITGDATIKPILEIFSEVGGTTKKLATTLPWPNTVEKPEGISAEQVHGEQLWLDKQDVSAWLTNEVLTPWLERGTLVPPNYRVIEGGIGGIQDAMNELKKGAVSGEKLLVKV